MPQFTQWNVPSPFPNILYNPAAVDAAIAKTQSELGNLDINRQELQLRQDAAARDVAFGDYLKRSLPTDGTTGAAGAAPGGSGSFLGALAQIESGDKNIVSGTDKDNKGLTLAQGGNPQEISQGHFQIHTGTWKDFAPQAGVDVSKYPNAMSAPREIQAQVASVIPFKRFGPRTQTMMRQQFGDIDSNRTVGELAGLGPRAGSAAVAGPVAVAPPPATRQAGALPVPPIPPAVAPSADPNARVEADDPNTAAVKQASAALLQMPEPDAAAAYPGVVRELQARGFAMNAPPTYPGHAALQALVGGGEEPAPPPIEASRQAMRLGGTDVAGPPGVVTMPPVEQPNRLYSTGLAGVTINAPGNPLAPPVQTAAAPAQAQPRAASPQPQQPPPAPSRVIQREPLIQSGIFAGLTRTQAATIANTPGVKPATIMDQIATARHQNDVIRQGDATQAAIDEKENYARWHQSQQDARQRENDKAAAQKAAEDRVQREIENKRAEGAQKLSQAANDREAAKAHEENLNNLTPKIEDGTATPAEKRLYAGSYYALQQQGATATTMDDPNNPGQKIPAMITRRLPKNFPEPEGGALPLVMSSPGAPTKPAATRDEGTSATFADRMAVAETVMKPLDTSAITWSQGVREKAGNFLGYNINSTDYQKLRTAQEAFLSAIIRDESGAAVSDAEWKRYAHIYFPMPGDDAEQIKLKQQFREVAQQSEARKAGAGYKPTAAAAAATQPPAPKVIKYDATGKRVSE